MRSWRLRRPLNKARGDSVAADFEKIKKEDCRAIARRLGLELNRQDKARCYKHCISLYHFLRNLQFP